MTIHHIVLLKFKQGTSPADADTVRKSLHALPSQIPFISGATTGTKIKTPFDHDFDEGVVFVFKDKDALQQYVPHPTHRAFQELLALFVEEKLIFDIHSDENKQTTGEN